MVVKVQPRIIISALDLVSSHHSQMDLISGEYEQLNCSLQLNQRVAA